MSFDPRTFRGSKSMGHKSCTERNPHRERVLSFYIRIYLWVSIKIEILLLLKLEMNNELFGIILREMSLFPGDAPELIHNYRALFMPFATCPYIVTDLSNDAGTETAYHFPCALTRWHHRQTGPCLGASGTSVPEHQGPHSGDCFLWHTTPRKRQGHIWKDISQCRYRGHAQTQIKTSQRSAKQQRYISEAHIRVQIRSSQYGDHDLLRNQTNEYILKSRKYEMLSTLVLITECSVRLLTNIPPFWN